MVETPAHPKPKRMAIWFSSLWERQTGYYGLAFGGALLLAILYTWPVILQPDRLIPGQFQDDQNQNIWSLWWIKHALLDLHTNPFNTNYLFYPGGTKLYLYALNPLSGLLALPVTAWFGPVSGYSFTVILGLSLTGLAATALCRAVSNSRLGGLVAGYGLTFSVVHFTYMAQGQLEFISLWPLLFYFTFLTALIYRSPEPATGWRRQLRQAVPLIAAAVVSLLAAGFVTLYYVSFGFLFSGFLVVFRLIQVRRLGNWLLHLALTWLIFGILFSPVALRIFQAQKSGQNELAVPYDVVINQSVPVPTYLFGFDGNVLLGHLLGLARTAPFNFAHYLGFSLLVLAGIGVRLSRRESNRPWPWLLTGLVFAALSFGPALRWDFTTPAEQLPSQPYLPWNILHATPLLSLTNNPMRCELLVATGLAAGAAVGVRELLNRWGKPVSRVLLSGLLAGVVLESAALPGLTRPIEVPPQVSVIQADCAKIGCGDAAVLDLPFSKDHYLADAKLMLWSALRQKPLMGGYLSRRITDPYDPEVSPFRLFRQLAPLTDIFEPGPNTSAIQILNYWNIRYITVNPQEFRRIYTVDPGKLTAFLTGIVGNQARIFSNDTTTIYRVPELPASEKHPFIVVGEGWLSPEQEQPVKRWAGQSASFSIYSFASQPVNLSFEATAFAHPRKVKVLFNRQLLQEINIAAGSWQSLSLNVALQAGQNELQLVSEEPAQSPASLDPSSRDTRQLSIALRQVKLGY